MIIYISGPMSNLPENNFPAFNKAAAYVSAFGHTVLNPAEKGIIEGYTWEDYLKIDLHQVIDSDMLILLSGWEHSKGAQLEVHVASSLGIPTVLFEIWQEENVLSRVLHPGSWMRYYGEDNEFSGVHTLAQDGTSVS
jgi:hypothetical protein